MSAAAAPAPAPEPEPAPAPAGAAVVTRRVYRLEPDPATDPDLADLGLWMRVRAVTLGQLLDYGFGPRLTGTPDAVFREFVSGLVDWNLHDETGAPIPPTWEGFKSLDEHLARRLMGMWQQLLTGAVPGPFGARSSGTPPATPEPAPAPPMAIPMTPTAS